MEARPRLQLLGGLGITRDDDASSEICCLVYVVYTDGKKAASGHECSDVRTIFTSTWLLRKRKGRGGKA